MLDEPFAGIDARSQRELCSLIRELADLGNTVVLATDHVELLDDVRADVALLADGRIAAWGSPHVVLADGMRDALAWPARPATLVGGAALAGSAEVPGPAS